MIEVLKKFVCWRLFFFTKRIKLNSTHIEHNWFILSARNNLYVFMHLTKNKFAKLITSYIRQISGWSPSNDSPGKKSFTNNNNR